MSRAIADPEEIIKFSRELFMTIQELGLKQAQLSSQFALLHDHWQDVKYERFREVFSSSMRKFESFYQAGLDYASYLAQKAGYLQRYLDRRY